MIHVASATGSTQTLGYRFRCHARFAAERLVEYLTRASNKYRDAAATATIEPALGSWMARPDTLPTHVAEFFEPPPSEPRVRAVASIAAADSSTPNVSSLLAASRLAHVATTAGPTLPLVPPPNCGIVSRQSLEGTSVTEEYFARLHRPMRSSTSSSSARPAPPFAHSPFDEPLSAFVPLSSACSTWRTVTSCGASAIASLTTTTTSLPQTAMPAVFMLLYSSRSAALLIAVDYKQPATMSTPS